MPTFVFTSPEGKKYSVNGPEGATEQQAWEILQSQLNTTPEAPPSAPTSLRDIGVAGASGAVGAAKSMTDVFGADNFASKALGETSADLQGMYTPERQKEMQYYQKLQDDAAARGDTLGEVGASLQGIKAAPLQSAAQAIGSLIPNLATLLIPVAGEAKAAAAARGAINTAIGIVQGTGAVKGALYEGVREQLIKSGIDEQTASERAAKAQEYFGDNADQILTGAVIGGVTGKTGAEELLSPAVKGAARKAASVVSEMGTEAIQGGQEQVAQNIGLQREGFDTPTFQGVAGAATQEGILGGLGAAPLTLMHGRKPETQKEEEENKQETLLLTNEKPFYPTPLPDGSVAMTREELQNYEDEQFRKKYAPQDYERGNALKQDENAPLLLEGPPPFTPVALPDGSVATSQADLDQYLKDKREQDVAAPKRPELLNIIDKIQARVGIPEEKEPLPTDEGLSYATATQEIEILKSRKQTPEIKSRIQDLEKFKSELFRTEYTDKLTSKIAPTTEGLPEGAQKTINQQFAKEEQQGETLADLRKAIESGAFSEESIQKRIDAQFSNMEEPPSVRKLMRGKKPVTPEEEEILDLAKEARSLTAEYNKLKNTPNSLKSILAGRLSPKEASEVGAGNEFKYLISKDYKKQTGLDSILANTGDLKDYLPVNLREVGMETEAAEHIRQKLRSGDFKKYDVSQQMLILGNQLGELDARLNELSLTDKANVEVNSLPAQERKAEAVSKAEKEGFTPAPLSEEQTPAEAYEGMPPVKPLSRSEEEQTLVSAGTRPKYMQAKAGERGMSKADVDVAVDRIKSTWENAPDIEVVQKISELPEEIQADIARDKVNPRGVYDPDTKKVWLVADNIPNDAQAAITLAHEALGHFGLRVVLGKNFKQMMSDIYQGNKNVKARADAYIKDGMDLTTAVEEVLSEMAQEIYDTSVPLEKLRANRTALQKIMNAIRQFLSRLGLPVKTIDDATVLDLIRNARHAVVKGAVAGEMAGGKAKFSVKDRAAKAAAKTKDVIHKAGQKRPMDKEAFSDLPDELVNGLEKTFNPESKTIITKIDGMKDKFWQRMAQGIVDQYRTIKDYTSEGYMLARLSKTIDGALEGMMFHGQVFLNQGALDIKPKTQGLFEVMAPLGKDVDRYQMWVALNREAQLVKQGKNPSIDPNLVKNRFKLAEGKIGKEDRAKVYKDVRNKMNELNKSVLDIALEQGLIDKTAYEIFAADINYIPFYKAMEDGDIQGAATSAGLGGQYFSKMLEGGEKPFGDLMENTLRNWSHILSASMKNKAADVTLEAASKPDLDGAKPNLKVGLEWKDGKVYSIKSGKQVGDGKVRAEQTTSDGTGLIKVMKAGKPAYYKVIDPLLLDSVASIGYLGPKSKFLDVARDFKNVLQYGVTLSPGFKVRNLFRDSIQAMAVSGLKLTPWANIVEGWAASAKNNPAHISALAGGGVFNFGSAMEGDQSRLIKKLIKMGVSPDSILDSDNKIKAGLQKAWAAYTDLGNKSEAANRMALYKQMRDAGMSHLEASFHARDLLDFSMQGSFPALRMVTQVVPFLNARLQGLYKLGKDGIIPFSRVIYNTSTGKPSSADEKKKAKQFGVVTGAVMLASMMLYLAFKDDEEFKKREEWDRDNFWWFRLPGMDEAVRVPKPFEIGAFGTMTERLLEQMIDQGAEGKQFEDSFKRMLTDTFAINPTPQFIKPMIDLYANKDSFTGAPIETAGMERLSKAERSADSTSPLAQALSSVQRFIAPQSMELSPVQVDYAIKSYFGWLGGTVAATSHYAVMPFSKGAYPDHDWTETMSMGFIKSLPATQSKYVTAFYENNKQISQAYADMRHYAELGELDKVQQILDEKGDMIGLQKYYDRAAKDMAKVRQNISAIRNDETMSGAEKKEQIDRLKLIIGDIAEQMESARKSIKQ